MSHADVTYCPRHTCGSPVILEGSSTAALCSVCGFAFCVTCRKTYHGADNCQAKKNMKEQTEIDLHQNYADLPQSLGTDGYVCVCVVVFSCFLVIIYNFISEI